MYTKSQLIEILREEKEQYLLSFKSFGRARVTRRKRYYIWKYLYYFRLTQYYTERIINTRGIRHCIYKFISLYFERMKNIYSYKSGVEIARHSQIGRGIDIWHGGVVINGTIGEHCVFHGNNIVGNKGAWDETAVPVLGNNIEVGAGATIIGGVTLADDIVIGAGATVVKSEGQKGSVLLGVPAKARSRTDHVSVGE